MRRAIAVGVVLLGLSACGGSAGEVDSGDGGASTCGAVGGADACTPVSLGALAHNGELVDLKADNTSVYFADSAGEVFALPIAGGSAKLLTAAPADDTPLTLALDATQVYFAGGGSVGSVPRAGGASTTLVSGENPVGGLVATSTALFWWEDWTEAGGGASGVIHEMPSGGGTVGQLASNLALVVGLVCDGSSLYWSDLIAGQIDKVPMSGGPVQVLAENQEAVAALATDGKNVYWATDDAAVDNCGAPCGPLPPPTATDSHISSVPVNGGAISVLATGYQIDAVAVDGNSAYWFDAYQGTLSRVPVAGGAPVVLATGVAAQLGPVLSGNAVYWIDGNSDALLRLGTPTN